jgi:hypothetical protein
MSRAARHAGKSGQLRATITRRTGEMSFVAIGQDPAPAANQQVGAGFGVRRGPGEAGMEPTHSVAGGDY